MSMSEFDLRKIERNKMTPVQWKQLHEYNLVKFNDLVAKGIQDQVSHFLKSFIFSLGDDWKSISELAKEWTKMCTEVGEHPNDLNPVAAADFLHKHGKERTALQRKEEIADVDLDANGLISFIEYLLLAQKTMILKDFYKRAEMDNPHDLSRGGIGVVGVGKELLDELFTMPAGLDPAIERAIDEFTEMKKAQAKKRKTLEARAAKGGVMGKAAANELLQMDSADKTEENKIELTLAAAKRKAAKQGGEALLNKKKAAEEKAKKEAASASKARLKAKAALWK